MKDFLKFFEIKHFCNEFYSYGTDACRELITERESAVAVVFDYYLRPLFEYDLLKHWELLYEYVKCVYHNFPNGGTTCFVDGGLSVDDERFMKVFKSMGVDPARA